GPSPRVVIEGVTPEIDGGRFPVKRVVGDTVTVGADVFAEGHDRLAAVLRFRPAGGEEGGGRPRWAGGEGPWEGAVGVGGDGTVRARRARVGRRLRLLAERAREEARRRAQRDERAPRGRGAPAPRGGARHGHGPGVVARRRAGARGRRTGRRPRDPRARARARRPRRPSPRSIEGNPIRPCAPRRGRSRAGRIRRLVRDVPALVWDV